MLEKRSLSIAGHRTSIALEPEFWAKLETIAVERVITPLALMTAIDSQRNPQTSLASALRIYALQNDH
jgi:predicted DNA-binding ribbon-helix-helix protein